MHVSLQHVHPPHLLLGTSELERSRQAAARHALLVSLPPRRPVRLDAARLRLARLIAPRGLELVPRAAGA
ncbi:hypothetical protein [Auraticoccus monumenti]|uniref:Uncharacterized protein n=1 Tax=Auraticoccus monumenti TaxID=675864 RepID=A0A1G6SBH8_9ACTN|nr:hypothetical protein [Auraticoccus monumenti]SDD13485.1 hypothetical protein SAMN04489747_0263 [Auraticoccus monumenti]